MLAALEQLVDLCFEYFEVEDGVDEEAQSSCLVSVESFQKLFEMFEDRVQLLDDRSGVIDACLCIDVELLFRSGFEHYCHPHRQLLNSLNPIHFCQCHMIVIHSILSEILENLVKRLFSFFHQLLSEVLLEIFLLSVLVELDSLLCVFVNHHLVEFSLEEDVPLGIVFFHFVRNLASCELLDILGH